MVSVEELDKKIKGFTKDLDSKGYRRISLGFIEDELISCYGCDFNEARQVIERMMRLGLEFCWEGFDVNSSKIYNFRKFVYYREWMDHSGRNHNS